MYGSINNVGDKSDSDLDLLKGLEICDLCVGIESGWDEVLRHHSKVLSIKIKDHGT